MPTKQTYVNRPGIGIDSLGGQVIDPTKNVEDLVKALEVTNEKLRIADARRLEDVRVADGKRIDDLREADRIRLNELATQKREYDKQIFDIQTVQVKTTSDLISAQLSKETASLANQINAATVQNQGLISTLSERIGKLEQERWTITGKSSVADPALASALADMAASIQGLTKSETKTDTRRESMASLITITTGAAIVVATLISVAAFILTHSHS